MNLPSVARFSSQSQSSDLALKEYKRKHCQALEPSVFAKASDPRRTKALDCPWNQGPGFNAEGALLKDEPFLEAKRKPGQGCESGVIKKNRK